MSILFSPDGTLNVARDPSDLPQGSDGQNVSSGAMVRCKNLRINQQGIAKTRDGSEKLNASAIDTPVWWIEEQDGTRYSFAGASVYSNEVSIAGGLTEAQWAAIQYNAFNDTQLQIFALNGTNRKRIEGGVLYEWGIAAPETAPVLSEGHGSGLTGEYNARYTYVRKIGSTVVAESNPSPVGTTVVLSNGSLAVSVEQPDDTQVTHIRLYRTFANNEEYFFDRDVPAGFDYGYGYAFDWERDTGAGLSTGESTTSFQFGMCFEWESPSAALGVGGYKWTNEDDTNLTENAYTWEERYDESVSWAAAISSATVGGVGTSSTVHSSSVTVTVTDANGTPTYAWIKVSGAAIFADTPSVRTTTFRASGLAASGETRVAVFRCIVTDLPDSATLEVTVTIERTSVL